MPLHSSPSLRFGLGLLALTGLLSACSGDTAGDAKKPEAKPVADKPEAKPEVPEAPPPPTRGISSTG